MNHIDRRLLQYRTGLASRAQVYNTKFTIFAEDRPRPVLGNVCGSLCMSAVETALSFDDILEAVRESRRGRWFLEEFEKRSHRDGTERLLAAIAKLESVASTMGSNGPEAETLARARAAIFAARKDIANIDTGAPGLSEEGRLFAKLANMARRSFAGNSNVSPSAVNTGVVRALRLVDELETDLCGPTSAVMSQFSEAPGTPAEFFKQDADIFEAPKAEESKPAPVVAEAPVRRRSDIEEPKGAKLVINRVSITKPEAAAEPVGETPQPAPPSPPPEPEVEKPVAIVAVSEPPKPEPEMVSVPLVVEETKPVIAETASKPAEVQPRSTPRVVIIRKKPEEMIDVPLVDTAPASASAA